MSRIGKRPVTVPKGVTLDLQGYRLGSLNEGLILRPM